MTYLPVEKNLSPPSRDGGSIVVIDHRVLFRESFIHHLNSLTSTLDICGFSSVAGWRAALPQMPVASMIVIAAAHRSVAQMDADLAALAAISPGVPVVLLSEMDDYNQVAEAMRRGLRGFIPVTSSVKVAQSALALVLAGGCFVPSDIVCNRSAPPAAEGHGSGSVRLTERETAVLGALQIGKPNKIIAYELKMCTNTVKVHVRNIMKKLHAKNRTELAYLVNSQGIGVRGPRPGGAWLYGGATLGEEAPVLRLTAASMSVTSHGIT